MFPNEKAVQTVSTKARTASRFGWIALLSSLPMPILLFAETDPCADPTRLCNQIKYENLTSFFLAIINVAIQYGAILIVFFIVFAGFKFVTAQGNSEKVSEARKMLTWVIVGAFVLLGE